MSYIGQIFDDTMSNKYYRKVIFTGNRSQLVVMQIEANQNIGEEKHEHVEQLLFILQGKGKAILDGKETEIKTGDVVVVTPGTVHDIVNTTSEPLKIFTVYAPPNHVDGTIHPTKADAVADTKDEAFGESVV